MMAVTTLSVTVIVTAYVSGVITVSVAGVMVSVDFELQAVKAMPTAKIKAVVFMGKKVLNEEKIGQIIYLEYYCSVSSGHGHGLPVAVNEGRSAFISRRRVPRRLDRNFTVSGSAVARLWFSEMSAGML